MKISAPLDCNKTVKQNIIYQMHVSYVNKDFDTFGSYVTDDFEMEIISRDTIYGWINVKEHLQKLKIRPKRLVLTQIISNGKYGSAHGKYVYEQYEIAFSNFYEFVSVANSKVKKTITYLVEVRQ